MRELGPEALFARLDELIEWAKQTKVELAQHSALPVDLLPVASFWRDGRLRAVLHCLEPEHGDDLLHVIGECTVHLRPDSVCVVVEGENPERGTCLLGFAAECRGVVEARAFYSTVDNVPVFAPTERAPLAVAEVHPIGTRLMPPFITRARGTGDVETLARSLRRHRVVDIVTGVAYGPYLD